MSVKRYYWDRKSDCDCEIVEQPDGAMVDYDEHASVVAALEAKCAALAAENAGLKSAIKEIVDSAEEAEYDGYFSFVVNPDAIHAGSDLIESETPATDAFLADVLAQGVEMLVKHCEQKALEKSYDFFMDAGAVAAQFAAQLRKGVQS